MMAVGRAILAVLLVALALACTRAPDEPSVQRPRNLLLVTIDTLRADRIGAGLTPALDRLAARGLRFVNARTVAPLTLPAHTSIMTGLMPPAHGVRVNGVVPPVPPATLAARFQRACYRTGAVVGAFVLDRRFGLAAGFDSYDDQIARHPSALDELQAERRANVVIDRALAWLGQTGTSQPLLLWVHLYDPHAPYAAPAPQKAAESPAEAYDQEIAFADAELARLLAALATRADAAATAIVVAGDHGESLGEHGEATHGMLLFEPALRVPLIVVSPGTTAAVRSDPASLVDVLPTALAAAGQPADAALPGRNLLGPPDSDRETYAETEYPAVAGWTPSRVLVQDRWKLIVSTRPRLFDLSGDPGEQHDVSSARGPLVQAMSARLDRAGAAPEKGTPRAGASTVDPETAARLRALGYVAPTTATATATPDAAHGIDAADEIDAWEQFERALSAQTAGRHDEATGIFAALARDHPDGSIFQSSYARALSLAGRSADALAIYRRLVKRWPADPALYHELAVAARDAGRGEEALRADQAALALAPDLASAHNGAGLLHADAGRPAEAARAFEQALRGDPTNTSYMVNLGNARRAMGQLDEAAASYRQALDRDPVLPDAANGLGTVLVQKGQAAEGVRWLEQAVSADPAFTEAQLNLGIALQESGQRDRALTQYRLVERIASPRSREREAAGALRQQLERR